MLTDDERKRMAAIIKNIKNITIGFEMDNNGFIFTPNRTGYTVTGYVGREIYINVPAYFNGKVVSVVGNSAFANNSSLKRVSLPFGLNYIGHNAFENCLGLAEVYMPNSIIAIGSAAFKNCTSLESARLPKHLKVISRQMFYNCKNLYNFVINDKIELIEFSAFRNCWRLKQIEIPDSVVEIQKEAFAECLSLESAIIGNGVRYLAEPMFLDCLELKEVVIGEKVDTLSTKTFANCPKLSRILINNGNRLYMAIDSAIYHRHYRNVIFCAEKTPHVKILKGIVSIDRFSFLHCEEIDYLVIPKSLRYIEMQAFWLAKVNKIFYEGSCVEWNNVNIGEGNRPLKTPRYYYSETKPVIQGNYWRYINGVPKVWGKE